MLGADLDTGALCESLKKHEKVWAAAGSHYGRDGEGFVRSISQRKEPCSWKVSRGSPPAQNAGGNAKKNEGPFFLVRTEALNVRYYRWRVPFLPN